MKGPFERLKYDLRRLWECPSCKRRERSDGTVTTRFCTCPGKGAPESQRTAMKLVEEAGHRAVPEIKYRPAAEIPTGASATGDVSIVDALSGDATLPPELTPTTQPPADA